MKPTIKADASTGYQQIYEALLPQLEKCDFSSANIRLDMSVTAQGESMLDFLGRQYVIRSSGVYAVDGKATDTNVLSILAYYALSDGEGKPKGDYCMLSSFVPVGLACTNNTDWMTKSLSVRFSNDLPGFMEAVKRLGGKYLSRASSGGHIFLLPLLPKIPAQLMFYDADDEFPCEVKVLYDTGALRFLGYECLAFMQGAIVKALMINN